MAVSSWTSVPLRLGKRNKELGCRFQIDTALMKVLLSSSEVQVNMHYTQTPSQKQALQSVINKLRCYRPEEVLVSGTVSGKSKHTVSER